MATRIGEPTKKIGVVTSLVVNCVEVVGLGVTAWRTGSTAIRAQTAVNVAEVAVVVFLLVGVLKSGREPDERHPLGHGRERFFWSLFAALGLFFGGGGLAIDEAIRSALNPAPIHSYTLAYVVLGATAMLDGYSLVVGLRPLRQQAARRNLPSRVYLRRSTDPASVTVVVGSTCAVVGAFIAAAGMANWVVRKSDTRYRGERGDRRDAHRRVGLFAADQPRPHRRAGSDPFDVAPDAVGGVVPTGRGRGWDFFAVVVGPQKLVIDGNIIFADDLTVSVVENTIIEINKGLSTWPMITYIYLTPVPAVGARLVFRSSSKE